MIKIEKEINGNVAVMKLEGWLDTQTTAEFENNTYMKIDGTFDNPSNYDNSGTDIKEDPQFADPANGDFTISGATQVARKTGDPRWLP